MAVQQLNTGAQPGKILLNYPDLLTGDQYANGVSASVGLRSPGSSPIRLVVSVNGSNSLVGNQKAIQIGVPLVSSITRLDPNPINAGDMEFLVTFDRGVTGVDISDFTIDDDRQHQRRDRWTARAIRPRHFIRGRNAIEGRRNTRRVRCRGRARRRRPPAHSAMRRLHALAASIHYSAIAGACKGRALDGTLRARPAPRESGRVAWL